MLELTVVDAFADRPFTGNPAAVALVDAFPPDHFMQTVAREMNLAETAFAAPRPDGGHDLRWFTPTTEVELCGHATLATAHVLGGEGRFHTLSGWLICRPAGGSRIEMDFPADPPRDVDASELGALDLVGVRAVRRGRSDLLVEVADAAWLRAYAPDTAAIRQLDARCLIVTAPGDREGVDFVSRVFGPSVGVDEDPVTGSAHCTLAGHWAGRTGHDRLTGYQASARGGTVGVRLQGDRVVLTGGAVTVSQVRMAVDVPTGG